MILRDGRGPLVREIEVSINLVAYDVRARAFERARHIPKLRAREHAPRRIRGAYQDDHLRARRELTTEIFSVEREVARGGHRVEAGRAARHAHDGRISNEAWVGD